MRVQKISISIALLTALLGLSIGCNKHVSDDAIAKDVQTKAAADPDTKDSEVSVTAKEGKVTLSGKVKTPAAQQKIEQIAREEPGITAVDDQTSIEPAPAPAAAPAPEQAVQTPAPPPPPPAPVQKPAPKPIVVPAGTTLIVKVEQALGSKTSQTGQAFSGALARQVGVGERVAAIPSGAKVAGTVVNAKAKGKIKGEGVLTLTLTRITVRGKTYSIHTEDLENTIKGKGKRTAATTGGGAAGGALIGGIAGGGKGAGIGALVGAGAGLAGGAATGNQQIEIPVGTALNFHLSAPLTLPPPGE